MHRKTRVDLISRISAVQEKNFDSRTTEGKRGESWNTCGSWIVFHADLGAAYMETTGTMAKETISCLANYCQTDAIRFCWCMTEHDPSEPTSFDCSLAPDWSCSCPHNILDWAAIESRKPQTTDRTISQQQQVPSQHQYHQ